MAISYLNHVCTLTLFIFDNLAIKFKTNALIWLLG